MAFHWWNANGQSFTTLLASFRFFGRLRYEILIRHRRHRGVKQIRSERKFLARFRLKTDCSDIRVDEQIQGLTGAPVCEIYRQTRSILICRTFRRCSPSQRTDLRSQTRVAFLKIELQFEVARILYRSIGNCDSCYCAGSVRLIHCMINRPWSSTRISALASLEAQQL